MWYDLAFDVQLHRRLFGSLEEDVTGKEFRKVMKLCQNWRIRVYDKEKLILDGSLSSLLLADGRARFKYLTTFDDENPTLVEGSLLLPLEQLQLPSPEIVKKKTDMTKPVRRVRLLRGGNTSIVLTKPPKQPPL